MVNALEIVLVLLAFALGPPLFSLPLVMVLRDRQKPRLAGLLFLVHLGLFGLLWFGGAPWNGPAALIGPSDLAGPGAGAALGGMILFWFVWTVGESIGLAVLATQCPHGMLRSGLWTLSGVLACSSGGWLAFSWLTQAGGVGAR
jgi:hypothetical protein